MSIIPLPRFELEADPVERGLSAEDLKAYEAIEPPKTVVVRFGDMRMVGEFPASLEQTPGCGTKFVVKTHRGTELGEMLTTTCQNSGCGKSISRQEMLEYIDNSGGKLYPFSTNGRILRIANAHDLAHMEQLNELRRKMLDRVRDIAAQMELPAKIVGVEPILGEEITTVYYLSEDRIDFAQVVPALARELLCRVEMRQIGPREEARLNADYERCGQHCCCKQFLKVLKPVSMKSAKVQKGTLDPMKISGRCGRLMCCLRYEDVTYQELKKNLPHRRSRVGTPDGPGIVLNSQILTQLVLVQLESDGTNVAVPVESLCDPDKCPEKKAVVVEDPMRGLSKDEVQARGRRDSRQRHAQQDEYKKTAQGEAAAASSSGENAAGDAVGGDGSDAPAPRKRRRRGRKRRGSGRSDGSTREEGAKEVDGQAKPQAQEATGEAADTAPRRKTRRGKRRRRRGKRGGGGSGGGESAGGSAGNSGDDAG